jgi:hypothetical protein
MAPKVQRHWPGRAPQTAETRVVDDFTAEMPTGERHWPEGVPEIAFSRVEPKVLQSLDDFPTDDMAEPETVYRRVEAQVLNPLDNSTDEDAMQTEESDEVADTEDEDDSEDDDEDAQPMFLSKPVFVPKYGCLVCVCVCVCVPGWLIDKIFRLMQDGTRDGC